jgi:DNA-binding LacI/PurR family transcriptional regulator
MDELHKSRFACALAGLIDDSGLHSRGEWAEILNVTPAAISLWLNDKTLPRPEILQSLLDEVARYRAVPVKTKLEEFYAIADQPGEAISPKGIGESIWAYLVGPILKRAMDDCRHVPGKQRLELAHKLADLVTRIAYLREPVPKRLAHSANPRTATWAFLTHDLEAPSALAWLVAIQQVCSSIPIRIWPIATSDEAGMIETLKEEVQGVFVLSSSFTADPEEFERLARQVPVLFLDFAPLGSSLPAIRNNRREAGTLAARHLLEQLRLQPGKPSEIFVIVERLDDATEEVISGIEEVMESEDVLWNRRVHVRSVALPHSIPDWSIEFETRCLMRELINEVHLAKGSGVISNVGTISIGASVARACMESLRRLEPAGKEQNLVVSILAESRPFDSSLSAVLPDYELLARFAVEQMQARLVKGPGYAMEDARVAPRLCKSRSSGYFLRDLWRCVPGAFAVSDQDGAVAFSNGVAERLWRSTKLLGQPLSGLNLSSGLDSRNEEEEQALQNCVVLIVHNYRRCFGLGIAASRNTDRLDKGIPPDAVLHNIFDLMPAPLCIRDSKKRTVYENAQYKNASVKLGKDLDRLLGKHLGGRSKYNNSSCSQSASFRLGPIHDNSLVLRFDMFDEFTDSNLEGFLVLEDEQGSKGLVSEDWLLMLGRR